MSLDGGRLHISPAKLSYADGFVSIDANVDTAGPRPEITVKIVKVRKLSFCEAARLFGEILAPCVFLPARALGYLWYLMKKDKDEQSPCFITAPEEPPS